MDKINVLVTGCGGDIGQSIGKILLSLPQINSTIGCDIHDDHPSKFIYDECRIIVAVSASNYFTVLDEYIEKYNINLLLPTSEAEIRYYYMNNILDDYKGVPVIIPNKKSLEIGFDKLLTANYLKENDLPYPWTYNVSDSYPKELPCIMKSRAGSGSKDVLIINDEIMMNYYKNKFDNFIWQQFIPVKNDEYTCGLFRSKAGEIRTLAIRRKLVGGFTGFGEVIDNTIIEDFLIVLAKKLVLVGSINVQLRFYKNTPYVFEINPRFSSTVMFRDKLGFKDVMWTIEDKLNKPISNYIAPKVGTKFVKGYNEYIL